MNTPLRPKGGWWKIVLVTVNFHRILKLNLFSSNDLENLEPQDKIVLLNTISIFLTCQDRFKIEFNMRVLFTGR